VPVPLARLSKREPLDLCYITPHRSLLTHHDAEDTLLGCCGPDGDQGLHPKSLMKLGSRREWWTRTQSRLYGWRFGARAERALRASITEDKSALTRTC